MHYNLYYILKEDQKKQPLDPAVDLKILWALAQNYTAKPYSTTPPRPPTPKKISE